MGVEKGGSGTLTSAEEERGKCSEGATQQQEGRQIFKYRWTTQLDSSLPFLPH